MRNLGVLVVAVAVALAAGLTDPSTVAVASGGNIDPPVLQAALSSRSEN